MKTVKRALALVLALTIILTLSIGAFAASGTNDNSGKITIDNAVVGQTYTIYQILKLESYDEEAKAYSYKATTAWESFINGTGIKDTYVKIDSQGYVTWIDDADVAAFANLAQAHAKTNNIPNQGSKVAAAAGDEKTTTVTFDNLNLGYYLLDSSLGTLCSLDTTHTDVIIHEKNEVPTNEKKVEEDSKPGDLGSVNDADIGQMVKFVSKITIPVGSAVVVYHDKMSEGLSLVWGKEGKLGLTVYTDAALTPEKALSDDNYNVTAKNLADGCTFEVDFARYLNLVTEDTTLYIVYYATVNENAVVGGSGNPNESWLSYSEDGKTTTVPSKTTTYTWEINVYKYTMVKATEAGQTDTEKALANAEFILYKDVTDGDSENATRYYAVAATVDGGYRFTKWTTDKNAATKFVTPANGKFAIKGLDSDTYYLEETTAPAGYNVLKAPVKVVIDAEGNVTYGENSTTAAPDVKILNNAGAELPSTGGIGTTVFYVLGGVLVVCAGVLLITKRRMNKNA